MNNILIPNSTQIPNIILDFIGPRIPDAEYRCLMYICRRTFGFRKNEDRINFNQFINGIKNKDGKRFDFGTGISRDSVSRALQNLKGAGAIQVRKTGKGRGSKCFYRINLDMDCEKVVERIREIRKNVKIKPKQRQLFACGKAVKKMVRNSDQKKEWSEILTGNGQKFRPEMVKYSDPQYKGKQRETKNSSAQFQKIGDILPVKLELVKPVNTERWQGLALEIIEKIPDAEIKKSSVFKCCKDDEQKAKIAFEDCKELGKLHVIYFLKVYNELTK